MSRLNPCIITAAFILAAGLPGCGDGNNVDDVPDALPSDTAQDTVTPDAVEDTAPADRTEPDAGIDAITPDTISTDTVADTAPDAAPEVFTWIAVSCSKVDTVY